ncbi:MAG: DUF3090 family protein [Chloroflexi bacterium]|nr:DUF3090 family protein [Chloroflexota bacterium]
MEHERIDLGLVETIEATDVGEPGKRTFKITAESPRGRAVIWMEKEQLFQIGLAVRQFNATEEATANPTDFEPTLGPPSSASEIEFKATDIRIRHAPSSDTFTIEAVDPATEDEDVIQEPLATVQFSFPRAMAIALSKQALEATERGRPRCELCGGPKDPDGHVCPKTNGHHKGDFELA